MLDYLEVVIAFVYVVLMQSLLVTAIVEISQTVVVLRSSNLRNALVGFLERTSIKIDEIKAISGVQDSERKARKELVNKFANWTRFYPEKVDKSRPGWWWKTLNCLPKTLNWLWKKLTPRVNSVTLDDFLDFVNEKHDSTGKKKLLEKDEALERKFANMEVFAKERFKNRIRLLTIFISIIVVPFFGVNAFDAWQEISTNSTLREMYVNKAVGITEEASETITHAKPDLKTVVRESIAELSDRNQELAKKLERMSKVDWPLEDQLQELEWVLKDSSDDERRRVTHEFEEIWTSKMEGIQESTIERAKSYVADISLLPIKPAWGNHLEPRTNLFSSGMTVMVIFVSLGAPFWFKALKRLIDLRTAIVGTKDKSSNAEN